MLGYLTSIGNLMSCKWFISEILNFNGENMSQNGQYQALGGAENHKMGNCEQNIPLEPLNFHINSV